MTFIFVHVKYKMIASYWDGILIQAVIQGRSLLQSIFFLPLLASKFAILICIMLAEGEEACKNTHGVFLWAKPKSGAYQSFTFMFH